MQKKNMTKKQLQKCLTLERMLERQEDKIRRAIHADNCTNDPRACPEECSCEPELNTSTACAWLVAECLACIRGQIQDTATIYERQNDVTLKTLKDLADEIEEQNARGGSLRQALSLHYKTNKRLLNVAVPTRRTNTQIAFVSNIVKNCINRAKQKGD